MRAQDSVDAKVIIGTRASKLALAQTYWIRDLIANHYPRVTIEVKEIHTSADLDQRKSLRTGSQTGLFVKELEESLMAEEIDLAVHSLKDMPIAQPEALEIKAISRREDPRDALITREEIPGLADLPAGSSVGTGSIRRQAQILAARPDLELRDIRGNVDTRLRKLNSGEYDAVILACAGLMRLGMQESIRIRLGLDQMLPAPGQGALAVEIRKSDANIRRIVEVLNHPPTSAAVHAERAFLSHLGGGCNTPVAVFARVANGRMEMDGLIAAPDGSKILRDRMSGIALSAPAVAHSLAENLLDRGGNEILRSWG